MTKDHYSALGVHRDASAEEILAAYHELARRYHPNLDPNNPDAARKFKEVQAAFEVLGNLKQRDAYNRTKLSFATVRRSTADLEDERELAVRALAAVRRGSRSRPSSFIRQGFRYVPIMIDATLLWLVFLVLGIGLLAVEHSYRVRANRLFVSAEEVKFCWEQASSFAFLGRSLCFCATLVYGIAMILLLCRRFSR